MKEWEERKDRWRGGEGRERTRREKIERMEK